MVSVESLLAYVIFVIVTVILTIYGQAPFRQFVDSSQSCLLQLWTSFHAVEFYVADQICRLTDDECICFGGIFVADKLAAVELGLSYFSCMHVVAEMIL